MVSKDCKAFREKLVKMAKEDCVVNRVPRVNRVQSARMVKTA